VSSISGLEEIDNIESAAEFEVASDPKYAIHAEVSPSPHQCRFDVVIE
jgi:hypothetical protein